MARPSAREWTPVGSQNSSGESFAVSKPFELGCFLPLVAMMTAANAG